MDNPSLPLLILAELLLNKRRILTRSMVNNQHTVLSAYSNQIQVLHNSLDYWPSIEIKLSYWSMISPNVKKHIWTISCILDLLDHIIFNFKTALLCCKSIIEREIRDSNSYKCVFQVIWLLSLDQLDNPNPICLI